MFCTRDTEIDLSLARIINERAGYTMISRLFPW